MSMVPRKDVSFHKPAGKAEIERRKKMAEALMVQGQQPQNTEVISGVAVKQSPLAGLAKALTQGVGGYQAGQAAQMEQGREDAKRKAMADALGAYSSAGDPTKGALAMQQILMGNEETAPLALSQALENAQYDQRFPKELELAKAKAEIEAQYRSPPPAMQEFEQFQAMPPEQQEQFVNFKNKSTEKVLKPTEQKEFFDQQDKINASADAVSKLQRMSGLNTEEGTYEGPLAGSRAYAASFFGSDAANNTLELNDQAKSLAADILKSTFGGMPTEGERKFLVDLQGSANKSVEQRRRIIENGLTLIKNRISQSQEVQSKIQSGDYSPTVPSFAPLDPTAAGGAPPQESPRQRLERLRAERGKK